VNAFSNAQLAREAELVRKLAAPGAQPITMFLWDRASPSVLKAINSGKVFIADPDWRTRGRGGWLTTSPDGMLPLGRFGIPQLCELVLGQT
jgi:hypothetical protein